MTSPESGVSRPLAGIWWLIGAVVLVWLLAIGPAWLLAGPEGLAGLSAAAGLCLVPGILAMLMTDWLGGAQSSFVLASTGLRLTFVLLGTLVVKFAWPELGMREFYLWLILFYLLTLLIETRMLVKAQQGG